MTIVIGEGVKEYMKKHNSDRLIVDMRMTTTNLG